MKCNFGRVIFESLENRQLLAATLVQSPVSDASVAGGILAAAAATGPAEPTVTYIQSPNYNSRPTGQDIDAIVIHTTEGSYQSAVNTFLNPANQVSAHYIVNTDGSITQMVALDKRAWHATYYNSRSVGIEVVGFAGQASTWNANNVAALQNLTAWLAWKYDVPVIHPSGDAYDYPNDQLNFSGIVAHGQVQPWNRTDPGPYFPWSSFITNVQQIIDDAATPQQSPFKGTPFVVGSGITTTIQAEDYDLGGEGVAYHDTTPTNTAGAYRTGADAGVDIKLVPGTSNTYRISDAYPGEWVEYSINVQQAGNYTAVFRVSNADANAKLHAEIDGANVTGSLTVPDTNSFNTFTNLAKTISLPAGNHVLRLSFDTPASNGSIAGVDYIRLSQAAAAPVTIGTGSASYVRGGASATKNFGSSSTLYVKQSANADNVRETYLKFDLTSAASIGNAKLRLSGRLSDTQSSSVKVDVYSVTNTSWSESGLTYNNRPTEGAVFRGSTIVTGTSSKTYEIDLTGFLASEKAAGRNVVTLVLRGNAPSGASVIFTSDEKSSGPKLLVTP